MQERSDSPRRDSPQLELQALLDATVDAVILINHQGLVETFNRSGERLFGWRADEVIGRNVNMLMTSRDRDSHDAYIHRYVSTGVPHIIGIGREVDAQRKDGSVFPVFLSVGRIQSDPPRFVGLLHDITLRREAMAAIRRERDRANMYLEMAQVILVALSADLRIQLINRKGCDTLGRREADLLGRDWPEAAVPPEQRDIARAHLLRLQRRGGDAEIYCEHEVQVARGGRRLIAWRCIALHNLEGEIVGYFSSGEDITVRRAIEQSVERTRSLLNEAQEIGNIGNFEVHVPDTGVEFWSPQLHRIFGLDPVEDRLSLEHLQSAVHPEDMPRQAADWRAAIAAPGSYSSEFRIVTPGGAIRHVRSIYNTSPGSSDSMRIAGTILDITAAKQAEEDERLAQQRMTHVSRLATMGEMAAGIAHELNQPLAAIANYASAASRLVAAENVSDDVQMALEQIAAQALRAGEIIRRLRSLVQNRETHRESVEVNDLVGEVVSFSLSDARLHDVRIRTELAPALPMLSLDRIQVQQIVLNLIRNAIEALAERPANEREVSVQTAQESSGAITIAVQDNGPGVPDSIVARMFDPFCTTKETGTGLGLAISRTIAESHQGKLVYEPRRDRPGARFVLRLPYQSLGSLE
ncbi:MAG: PAS domain S-box protein [Steroidobacteraceae bacterium]|nr:PAS domain S-box protein [Nevskiaceae bacterium]MCP5359199.1 PAS domain S-box protein [Nevskiaceae bacterium]MCP5466432.1 PAS domain S-box protein [Nevskiaceae bacterium]MCP5471866.1 PAS domain S-box protein [Nevskiaceae bacterium]